MIQATTASMHDVTEKMDFHLFESRVADIDMPQYSQTFDRLFVVFESIDESDEVEVSTDGTTIYLIVRIPHHRMVVSEDPFQLMVERFLEGILQLEGIDSERLYQDCEGRLFGVKAV